MEILSGQSCWQSWLTVHSAPPWQPRLLSMTRARKQSNGTAFQSHWREIYNPKIHQYRSNRIRFLKRKQEIMITLEEKQIPCRSKHLTRQFFFVWYVRLAYHLMSPDEDRPSSSTAASFRSKFQSTWPSKHSETHNLPQLLPHHYQNSPLKENEAIPLDIIRKGFARLTHCWPESRLVTRQSCTSKKQLNIDYEKFQIKPHLSKVVRRVENIRVLSVPQHSSGVRHTVDDPGIRNDCSQ